MFFEELLINQNIPKQISEYIKKFAQKRIVIYGAGEFANFLFKNYDFSKLNIVAIADKKFEDDSKKHFFNYKCISPNELINFDCDVVLVANYDAKYFIQIVQELLQKNKKKLKILPLIKIYKPKIPFSIFWGFLYAIIPSDKLGCIVINFLENLFTCLIFNKKLKAEKIKEIRRKIKTWLYGYQVYNTAKYVGSDFWCGGFSHVTEHTIIKNHVWFRGMQIMGGGNVTIGNYTHSGIDVLILTQNHNYDKGDAIPYDDTYIFKDVEIGDFVWIGSKVTLLPGTKIGEGAIIQGGAVVHGEIPPYAIAGGNPAKVFKYRDIEHFKKIKAEKKFH